MTIAELLKAHRDEILAIAERHGASNVRIFGSTWNEEGRSSIMASSRLTWRSSSVER
jgi:predicted nucleotidyltransferase